VAAFEKNVEATIPALRRYARALTRDSEIADNLVERTLLRALRSKHRFSGGVARDRLYAILTNLNHDRLSSLARPPTLSPLEGNDSPDVTGSDAEGRDIERALSALIEDQRNAFLLVVLEGLTYREVAEVQGVPISTVTSRLARARDAIKNALEDGGVATPRKRSDQ
jgi:RNA polymerase sigma-70 factor, ECF subfamily